MKSTVHLPKSGEFVPSFEWLPTLSLDLDLGTSSPTPAHLEWGRVLDVPCVNGPVMIDDLCSDGVDVLLLFGLGVSVIRELILLQMKQKHGELLIWAIQLIYCATNVVRTEILKRSRSKNIVKSNYFQSKNIRKNKNPFQGKN